MTEIKLAIFVLALGMGASVLAYSVLQNPNPDAKPAPINVPIPGAEPFVDRMAAHDKRRWSISNNWTNGAYMVNDWQASQTQYNGKLTLTLARDISKKHPFSSGEIQSRQHFGHGFFETTMKAAKGSGIITGFFT